MVIHSLPSHVVAQIAKNLQPPSHTPPLCVMLSSNFNPCLVYCDIGYIIPYAWKPHFFHKKVWPYPIREDIFLLDSYVQVGYVKFEEISAAFRIGFQVHDMKVVTWIHHDQVCTRRTKLHELNHNLIKFNTTYLTYKQELRKNESSQTVQTDNSRFKYND